MSEDISESDIAIVGMALRVPGARSVDEFWKNLCDGVESIRDVTAEELLAAGERADTMARANYVPRTADLGDMEAFDAEFFGMSPKEAAIMDPQHRHFLECIWEALEDAGRPPAADSGPVGVFAGCGMGSYFYWNVCSHKDLVDSVGGFLLRHTGNDKDFLCTRASFVFDLKGPSVNVQTACSTSLVAAHYACQSLLSRECDMALAGGVTIELPHRRGYTFQEGEILSPDGHCRAFDHRAAGTVFGSGVGVVVLRRLADALRDGDQIHAVIKATAINNDGAQKAGYLAPSVNGQAGAIVEAQALAGVSAETIGYVECHGTGTSLGDPIEVEALTQAFRHSTKLNGYCRIGSVKTNIGHLDTAAGVVSLIKASLIVKHGLIPPSLGYEKPNPAIDFAASPFAVNDRLSSWPALPGPRRAGVNSLGVGGTNAHAVIEQPPAVAEGRRTDSEAEGQGAHLLLLSARTRKGLDEAAERLGRALRDRPELTLSDTAFTLATGRRNFDNRRIFAVRNRDDAIAALTRPDLRRGHTHAHSGAASGAVFLFPGGGAQYAGMARELYASDPAVRATIDEGLAHLPAPLAQEIRLLCFAPDQQSAEASRRLLLPSVQLPAILIVEVALARRWMQQGVTPKALIGHSMGENAAACIAGVLSFADAVNLVRLRGELFDSVERGGMLSVPVSEAVLRAKIPGDLDLASVNAPELCVVSGPDDRLEAFAAELHAEGIDAQRVPIDIAAHSRMLEPILERFGAFLASIRLSAPRIPIVSNLTGAWLTDEQARDPSYWVRHLRSTVLFAAGLQVLSVDQALVYVEVGPGRTLASLVKAQGSIAGNNVFNSLPHPDEAVPSDLSLLAAFGRGWAMGLPVRLAGLFGKDARRVSLPTYPFQRQRYFLDRVTRAEADVTDAAPTRMPDMADWGYRPVWRQSAVARLADDNSPAPGPWLVFLDDHGYGDEVVRRLTAAGCRVSVVVPGDNYRRVERGRYILCPENGLDGYASLLADLASDEDTPAQVLHLWLLTEDESFRPGSSFFHRNLERGFYGLFLFGKALASSDFSATMQIRVVGNGFSRVGEEALPYPEKATVLGPVLVLPKEITGLSASVVDLPLAKRQPQKRRLLQGMGKTRSNPSLDTRVLEALWEETLTDVDNAVVAVRDGKRWIQDHARRPLDPVGADGDPWRRQGVYLVTGGHGEMALTLAERLAQSHQARFVLVGRRDIPGYGGAPAAVVEPRTRRIIECLRRIEAAGGEVLCVRADVGNVAEMKDALAAGMARFGRIDGVLHAAGVVRDQLVSQKQVADAEDVLAPKLYGTTVLRQLLADMDVPLVVLFSSTSTDIAPAGQVDYVAANYYLNAVAEADRSVAGRRTVAVHWGVWSDVGLAARAVNQNTAEPDPMPLLPRLPLLDSVLTDDAGAETVIGEWGPSTVWMLDEHRLASGDAVVPATGYLQAAALAARSRGLAAPVVLSDVSFVKPLAVADRATVPVQLSLAVEFDSWRWSLASRQTVGAVSGLIRHAEGLIGPVERDAPGPLDLGALQARLAPPTVSEAGGRLVASQEPHLRFGRRWHVLRSVALGSREALAKLSLPEDLAADLPAGFDLHPGLLDVATGYAMDLLPNYDAAEGLWAPLAYGSVTLWRAMPSSIWSWVRLVHFDPAGVATFDVAIVDENGGRVVDVTGFTIRKLDRAGSLSVEASERDVETLEAPERRGKSPALARLAAFVAQGIRPDEGLEALTRAVAAGRPQVVVTSLDLETLKRQSSAPSDEPAQAAAGSFDRPDLDSEFVAPQTDIEKTLAEFWSTLLGIKSIGVNDSFFDLGGHSLIAVRLFRMIKSAFATDFPISVLFQAPTIAQCAEMISRSRPALAGAQAASGAPDGAADAVDDGKSASRVLMQIAGQQLSSRLPLFICSGMYGNILNLRPLALRIGKERPVYGIQARGLFGDERPHDDFVAAAADYLGEIRRVQPHGPYILVGYSGGGLVALEMARLLLAEGEDVLTTVLLDTPQPTKPRLSVWNRVEMRLQDFRRTGLHLIVDWVRSKLQRTSIVQGENAETDEAFHNRSVGEAFMRALAAYKLVPYEGHVLVVRPPIVIRYRLSDGRDLNVFRDEMTPDNGWSAHCASVGVAEVPGDHSSMMLEPNVRVLAAALSEEIRSQEKRHRHLLRAAE